MKNALLCLALALCLYACKKDKGEDLPPAISGFDYLPLDSGNYWIYQWYEIDSNGVETIATIKNDTLIAEGDTTIKGVPHKKFRRNTYGAQQYNQYFYRDSLGILMDVMGDRYLTGITALDTLHVSCNVVIPWQCIIYIMNQTPHNQTVPAGTFSVIDRNIGYIDNANKFCNGQHIRYASQTYAKGVGMVTDQLFYVNDQTCKYWEARLVKYHVQ